MGITTVKVVSIYILIFNYIAIVQSDGTFTKFVTLINEVASEIVSTAGESISLDKEIYFILYNEHHPSGATFSRTNYENININFDVTSKFLIHGWNSDEYSPMPESLKNEYAKLNLYNIVIVDWSVVAGHILYPISANHTAIVGEYIADVLLTLYENSTGADDNLNVHLIGFSLGAHVAGFAGRMLKEYGFTVDRITGLDPAEPFIIDGLQATDGAFVDVIHTTPGLLGEAEPVGHADFYPNGGAVPQPHCTSVRCSHRRSWQYFAKSIDNIHNYLSFRCRSYADYLNGINCDEVVYMGEGLSRMARGVYFLSAYDIYD